MSMKRHHDKRLVEYDRRAKEYQVALHKTYMGLVQDMGLKYHREGNHASNAALASMFGNDSAKFTNSRPIGHQLRMISS